MSVLQLNEFLKPQPVQLKPHPVAREQAVAKVTTSPGSIIASVPAFADILLPEAKGQRCDHCHCIPPSGQVLRRCTGCASYWYCDSICQSLQWRFHHKYICKLFNTFTSSNEFQALPPNLKLDSLLLSHMAAQLKSESTMAPTVEPNTSPLAIFLSLLPGPIARPEVPPICSKHTIPQEYLTRLYARFGNNNFAVHSHLNTYAHGVFPLASRLFNHSCFPNAAARYVLSEHNQVTMEVIALREIVAQEEVCLPYLDPAMMQSRQQIFEFSYGFRCTCRSCQFLAGLDRSPVAPKDEKHRSAIAQALRDYTRITPANLSYRNEVPASVPATLTDAFHEDFLTHLSDAFGEASHAGRYDDALDVGLSILALYSLIYPTNYPQIGMHSLELAKTMWNAVVVSPESQSETVSTLHQQARSFLNSARDILSILGPEGDEGGPLEEIKVLGQLLDD